MTAVEDFPSAPTHAEAPQYPIESVDNALRLLWLFSVQRSLRLTDVSQYLDVASSTAHRLLAMLQYRGFVRQDPVSRAYEAGPTLDRIAFSLLRRFNIREHARPTLERLNELTEETVHIGILDGTTVQFLDSIESPRAVRVASRAGRSMPAHCTSTGKAMLATLCEEQFLVLYPVEELPKLTTKSVASRTELIAELARVRQRGYAFAESESEEGVCSVAVAVRGTATPAAINVSTPDSRMSVQRRKELAVLTQSVVRDLEATLA